MGIWIKCCLFCSGCLLAHIYIRLWQLNSYLNFLKYSIFSAFFPVVSMKIFWKKSEILLNALKKNPQKRVGDPEDSEVRTKYLEQSKEIKQNCVAPDNFSIYVCVIFDCCYETFSFGMETASQVFQIALKGGKFFLQGGGNLRRSVFDHLNLFQRLSKYWTSIKIKISMTCVYKAALYT